MESNGPGKVKIVHWKCGNSQTNDSICLVMFRRVPVPMPHLGGIFERNL